jgi:hypothetical protein
VFVVEQESGPAAVDRFEDVTREEVGPRLGDVGQPGATERERAVRGRDLASGTCFDRPGHRHDQDQMTEHIRPGLLPRMSVVGTRRRRSF